MILDDIKQKLTEINKAVYYGMADDEEYENIWDYIVFNRGKARIGDNRTTYTDVYEIHVVCENFVPEGKDLEVIKKVLEIKGMRLSESEGIAYDYVKKPSTNTVVEMMTITFVRARKCV